MPVTKKRGRPRKGQSAAPSDKRVLRQQARLRSAAQARYAQQQKASATHACRAATDQLRSMSESVNSRLKDEFGARSVRVRGAAKVMAHLMFGVLALTVDQWLKLIT